MATDKNNNQGRNDKAGRDVPAQEQYQDNPPSHREERRKHIYDDVRERDTTVSEQQPHTPTKRPPSR